MKQLVKEGSLEAVKSVPQDSVFREYSRESASERSGWSGEVSWDAGATAKEGSLETGTKIDARMCPGRERKGWPVLGSLAVCDDQAADWHWCLPAPPGSSACSPCEKGAAVRGGRGCWREIANLNLKPRQG